MSHYDDTDVDGFISLIQTKKTEEQYMKDASRDLGKILRKKPMDYRSFGPYWWAVKEMLKKNYKGKAWFMGNSDDPVVKNRNWHGTLFRTVIAGLHFHGEEIEYKSNHSYEHKGIQKPYTLVDHDAGEK